MNTSKMAAAILSLALVGAAPIPLAAHSLQSFENQLIQREAYGEITNREAPRFALSDAKGRDVTLDDFRGKVIVLNFVYARCKDICPLQSNVVASIQEKINATPMRDLVQFISIATDTKDAQETRNIMLSYAARFGLDPLNWLFLYHGSGSADTTIRLAERYGLKFTYTEDGDQVHSAVIHLIDKNGVIRARYHGLKFEPVNLVMLINALTNEHHQDTARPTSGEPSGTKGALIYGVAGAVILALTSGVVLLFRTRRQRTG